MNIYIIVLNFNTLQETLNLVSSIKAIDEEKDNSIKINLVIVDNASTDGSGTILLNKFSLDTQVAVLINRSNLGFASGNNMGYRYAYARNPDFIIFSNSDVLIKQNDFFKKLFNLYDKYHFGVCGPDVFNPITQIHQSPIHFDVSVDTTYTLKRQLFIYLDWMRILSQIVLKKTVKALSQKHKRKNEYLRQFKNHHDNACIHGSFIIFSKKYMKLFPQGICDKTFMYGEEDILLYFCQANHLSIIYDPTLQIEHFEGRSTMKIQKGNLTSLFYKNRLMKQSNKLLKQYVKLKSIHY